MKATKLNGLIIEHESGERVLFDYDGNEIVNLTKYKELEDLIFCLTQDTCPENHHFAKAIYGWARLLQGDKPLKDWDISPIKDRTIFASPIKPKKEKLASAV